MEVEKLSEMQQVIFLLEGISTQLTLIGIFLLFMLGLILNIALNVNCKEKETK